MGLIPAIVLDAFKGTRLGTWYRRRLRNNRILSRDVMNRVITQFEPDISEEERAKIILDMTEMAKKYRFSPEEYYQYRFKEKTEEVRKEFISDLNRIDYCDMVNDTKNLSIFNNKLKTYKVFGKFYKRDLCGVTSKRQKKAFAEFLEKHDRFIVKPFSGSCGQGVRIVDLSEVADREKLVDTLLKEYGKGGFIAEELICQSSEFAKFHPASVNTLRVSTVLYKEGIEVMGAFMRTGRGGSVVDNCFAGGVFGIIEPETGKIIAVGDEFGKNYIAHPDTNEVMLGYVVPYWKEALEFIDGLARTVKGTNYCGWDIAHTDKGWVLVEANSRGQFVWQMPTDKGTLKETNESLRRFGYPELKLGIE